MIPACNISEIYPSPLGDSSGFLPESSKRTTCKLTKKKSLSISHLDTTNPIPRAFLMRFPDIRTCNGKPENLFGQAQKYDVLTGNLAFGSGAIGLHEAMDKVLSILTQQRDFFLHFKPAAGKLKSRSSA
jgi:hypothetical protein